ncbi:MAG: SH3 domain-containing protein [Candidatus Promineifilaceae bacterium]
MLRGNFQTTRTWLQKKHNATWLMLSLLLLVSLACNAFAGNLEPLPEPPKATDNLAETPTPFDIAPTVTPFETASSTEATVSTLVDLNVRNGPGVQYDRVGFLSAGTSVAVIGLDKQSGWWKIQCSAVLQGDECWVAGRAQYVAAANVDDVPTAVAPATPTTIPPTVQVGRGLLAYLSDGELYVATLDLGQDPAQLASDAVQVNRTGGVLRFSFSPDGRRIAYVAGGENANNLNIVNVDGGDHRTLVSSTILPLEGSQAGQFSVLIDQIQWLPDGSGVAFNTSTLNLEGPGSASQEDLWVATLDGQLHQRFAAGQGGGKFLFEPDGRVILSRASELSRAVLGSQEESIFLNYEPVNTASEYVYYPSPQETEIDTFVAIPAADPWEDGAQTVLWRAPAVGPPVELGRITNIPLNLPVVWSHDGTQIAFIQQTGRGEEASLRLVTAAADTSGAEPYAGGPNLSFFAWQPTGTRFLYGGVGYYAIGQPQAPPNQFLLPAGQVAVAARWLEGNSYLVNLINTTDEHWELRSATVAGESASLATGKGLKSQFDIWLP